MSMFSPYTPEILATGGATKNYCLPALLVDFSRSWPLRGTERSSG